MWFIAAVAFALWLFSWAKDFDEYVLIGMWLTGIVAVLVCWRFNLRTGLYVSLTAATGLPAIVYWAIHILGLLLWGLVIAPIEIRIRPGMIITLVYCAATALALVALWVSYWVASRLGWRGRIAGATGIILVGATAISGIQMLRFRAGWMPLQVISDLKLTPIQEGYPPISISDDGSILAVAEPPTRGVTQPTAWLRIWHLNEVKVTRSYQFQTPLASSICVSPDGGQVAVVHRGGISIYDTSNGNLAKLLNVSTANLWVNRPCRFSPDGKAFVFCSSDYKAQKAFAWRTSDWALQHEQNVGEVVQPVGFGDGTALLTYQPGVDDHDVALIDLKSLQPIHRQRPREKVYCPIGSPDGSQLAVGYELLNWKTGAMTKLPAPVYAFVQQGNSFVTRRCDMASARMAMEPDWRLKMPFLRHSSPQRIGGQAVLFDTTSGKEICASPDYKNETFTSFHASADGTTIVGATFRPRFYVWRVPGSSQGSEIRKRAP